MSAVWNWEDRLREMERRDMERIQSLQRSELNPRDIIAFHAGAEHYVGIVREDGFVKSIGNVERSVKHFIGGPLVGIEMLRPHDQDSGVDPYFTCQTCGGPWHNLNDCPAHKHYNPLLIEKQREIERLQAIIDELRLP